MPRRACLRLTNTYGPAHARQGRAADVPRHLDPAGARGRGAAQVFGDGAQRRDFTYVDDAVDAFLLAATRRTRPTARSSTSAATSRRQPAELAELLVDSRAAGAYRLVAVPRRTASAIDIGDYYADDSKIRDATRLGARVGLREGLARTLDYYREHGDALLGRRMSVAVPRPAARSTAPLRDGARRGGRARARRAAASSSAAEVEALRGGVRGRTAAPRHAVGVASGTDAIELALRALGIGAGDEVITAAEHLRRRPSPAIERGRRDAGARRRRPATCTLDPGELGALHHAADARGRPGPPLRAVRRHGRDRRRSPRARPRRSSRTPPRRTAPSSADARPARSATRRRSASTRPRTSARSATRARSSPTIRRWRTPRARCAQLRRAGAAASTVAPGSTAGSTRCRRRSCRVKLSRLDGWNERRRALAERYRERLAGVVALPVEAPGARHAYHLFVVRSPTARRARARLERAGRRDARPLPAPIHAHRRYRELARPGPLARSERLAREVLSLPLYPELTDDEALAVVDAVREACRG